jgi:hypothetical protein
MKIRQLKRNILSAMRARLFYGHPIPQWRAASPGIYGGQFVGTDHYPRAKFMEPEVDAFAEANKLFFDAHEQMCKNIEQSKPFVVAKKSTGEVMFEFASEAEAIEAIDKAKRGKKATLVLVGSEA